MIKDIQSLVTDGEDVIKVANIHWVVFSMPALYCFIALMAALFFHPIMGGAILFVSLYSIYNAFIYYYMTDLVLTSKKVMKREGFLTRDWIRMEFSKIENAYLEQPILGRYLGYSTIIVSGVGQGSIAVRAIIDGDSFVKALDQRLSSNKISVSVD